MTWKLCLVLVTYYSLFRYLYIYKTRFEFVSHTFSKWHLLTRYHDLRVPRVLSFPFHFLSTLILRYRIQRVIVQVLWIYCNPWQFGVAWFLIDLVLVGFKKEQFFLAFLFSSKSPFWTYPCTFQYVQVFLNQLALQTYCLDSVNDFNCYCTVEGLGISLEPICLILIFFCLGWLHSRRRG